MSRTATRLALPLGENFVAACLLDSTYAAASEPHASLSPASLPMEAVPPSELPPAHGTPSDVLALPFTPIIPRLSWAEVAKSPAKTGTKHDFKDLIVVLGNLSANGNPRHRFSTVSTLLGKGKLDMFESAGVTQFTAYLQLAETAGIVAIEQRQGWDGWITFRPQRNTSSNNPPQLTPSQHAEARFRDLIKMLNGFRDREPRFSTVGPRLLRSNPSIYKKAGVKKFEEYVEAAVEAGIVTVRGVENDDGRVKLRPAYRDPPVNSSTPTSTISSPPTRTISTASPFGPLVAFLKSKQLESVQAIPFSDILAHFVATLGYPDLISLYTSVPGVTTFGQYINAAIVSGLVSLVSRTATSGGALMSLRDTNDDPLATPGMSFMPPTLRSHEPPSQGISSLPAQPNTPTTRLPSLSLSQEITVSQPAPNITSDSFGDIVAVLTQLQAETGESEFRFSSITPLLLKRSKPYASVGVSKFLDYIDLAMEKGVVRIRPGTQRGDGWVSLGGPKPGRPKLASVVSL
jgi:hypothetical protein